MIDITSRDVLIDAKVYLSEHLRIDTPLVQTVEDLKLFLRDKHGPAALIGTTDEVRSFWSNIFIEMMPDLQASLKEHCLTRPEFRPSRPIDALDLQIALSTRRHLDTTKVAG